MYFKEVSGGRILFKENLLDSKHIRSGIDIIKEKIRSQVSGQCNTVAIALPRSPEFILCIFALLELKITFMPIDLAQPVERIEFMLSIADIDYVIINQITGYGMNFDNIIDIGIETVKMVSSGYYDYGNNIAYILFTSGSTGRPKAVEVKRSGLENFFDGISEMIELQSGNRILCATSFTFDIFFLESIHALMRGLTVVLASEEERVNPRKLSKLIKRHEVDTIQMTPSGLQYLALCDKEFTCLEKVVRILVGGETFPKSLLNRLKTRTKARIYNLYGPTETTIWSMVSEVTFKETVDIGHPIKNTRVYLMDSNMKPVGPGETGEICISGDGLANGYRNNDEQTNFSFTYLNEAEKTRIYKTGDLGRYDDKGCLVFRGRKDNQIKLRGHRIELDEIDSQIMEVNSELTTVTCVYNDGIYSELVTFYTYEHEISTALLKAALEKRLPEFMVPKKFIKVPMFDYTRSGKIDRYALLNNNLKLVKRKQSY